MEDFSIYEIKQIILEAKTTYKEARSYTSLSIESTELMDEILLLEKYLSEYLKLEEELNNCYNDYYNNVSKDLRKAILNNEKDSLTLINNTVSNFKQNKKFERQENFKILMYCSKNNVINQTKDLNNKLLKRNPKISVKRDDKCNHSFLMEFTNSVLNNPNHMTNVKDPKVMMVCVKCGEKFVKPLSELDKKGNNILTVSQTFLDINSVDIEGAIEIITSDYQKINSKYNELGISESETINDFIGNYFENMSVAQKQIKK